MGFRIYCDNKGCMLEMEPVLDKAADKVYCTKCDKELSNITKFAKAQMVSLGQIRRRERVQKAFAVKCVKCLKEAPPKLDKGGKNLLCSSCEKPIENISAPFAHTIKQYIRTNKNQE